MKYAIICNFSFTFLRFCISDVTSFSIRVRKVQKIMKETTIDLIRTVLRSDETVPPEHLDSILKACRQTAVRRKLIGAKTAMEILQISRPTLREYVRKGLLEQINFSPRKVRFDEAEVQRLSYSGTSC